MWPFNLSVRLPIVALVGLYPANWLIGRESIHQRIAPLITRPCGHVILCGISVCFQTLSPFDGQVTHALLTRPPLKYKKQAFCISVRLACVRHAASVRPEPGSNSLNSLYLNSFRWLNLSFAHLRLRLIFLSFLTFSKKLQVILLRCLIFKVHMSLFYSLYLCISLKRLQVLVCFQATYFILSHCSDLVKRFFYFFLKVFLLFFLFFDASLCDSFYILSRLSCVVNYFFSFLFF